MEEVSFPEEVIGLEYHFLPFDRQAEVDAVLRALQADSQFEFMLAVLYVTVNGRPLRAESRPSRHLIHKLLQALDNEDGAGMLYASPYNQLGQESRVIDDPRLEWWDFDLAERLRELPDLNSIRAFLEYGTGQSMGRPRDQASTLHDHLIHGLTGVSKKCSIWGCARINTFDGPPTDPDEEGVWPADGVSPWFHGVFWDDLLFILNPTESTLTILAITSR